MISWAGTDGKLVRSRGLAQVKKMSEHSNFVNSCCPLRHGPPLLVSGSDDASAKVIHIIFIFVSIINIIIGERYFVKTGSLLSMNGA